jgi:hypothetical protein
MSERADSLGNLFGDYRSEWRSDDLGDLFVTPPYFGQLLSQRPTFLVGGRGTGKTTALKSLRFDSSFPPDPRISDKSLGLYIQINKNRVHAFQNGGRSTAVWSRVFAHYFNLLAAVEFLRVCRLRLQKGGPGIIDTAAAGLLSRHFGINDHFAPDSLEDVFDGLLNQLELYVNNTAVLQPPILSAAEAPLRTIARIAQDRGRTVYCCIDEYENLLDYQQGVLNTYIKHSGGPLTYKIGVRRFGLRNRETSDSADLLVEPDDYSVVDLSIEPFDAFAMSVAQRRMDEARRRNWLSESLDDVWPSLSRRTEAEALGAVRIADAVRSALENTPDLSSWANSMSPGDLYFVRYWSEASGEPLKDVVRSARDNPDEWAQRLNNHGYASLFWLSRGRRGARVRKYYCGIPTFLHLAGGNIRYFLELLDVSLQLQLSRHVEAAERFRVEAATQTEAAQEVGKRRLEQLEGLSEHGMLLKRLVLALGKVFFELARAPEGRTPEVTQFILTGNPDAKARVEGLLREGVSNQAFEVTPRTKATSDAEMRDDEYRLHPIFSPYFEFSYRRKRRISLSAEDLVLVQDSPRRAITNMLKGRVETPAEDLPAQLSFFSSFYDSRPSEQQT